MANLWSRENPLDPGTIPDVIRIMRQEIPDIEYKYHQTYREILIMEVMIAQRVRGGSKATRIAPHRFMVIGQNKNNGRLVTAHFFGTKMAWIHGLEKLTGRSQGLQDDISWASGLQLVLKLGVDHTARLSIKHADEDTWAEIEWEKIEAIVNKHEDYKQLEKGLAIKTPPGFFVDKDGELKKVQAQPHTSLQVKESTEPSVVEYKNRIPFEVDLHDKLTPSMYGTADTLFRTLQYGFFDFEQHQHVQFADLLGKAYPWKPINLNDFQGFREARQRGGTLCLTDYTPIRNWWMVAQEEPRTARQTNAGKTAP